MLKTVWINDLLIKLLNDASSTLFQSFMNLSNYMGTNECELCLYEPDYTDSTFYLVSKKTSIELVDKKDNLSSELKEKVVNKKENYFFEGYCYAPLYFENISTFGYIKFKCDQVSDEINFTKALINFSYFLFAECLGSIVKSYHDTIIRTENLCIDYKTGKQINRVVKGVNLDIYKKEFTMIFGASGSGKSSILNVLGGLLTASEGKVFYGDKDITNLSEKEKTSYRCNVVGFIFQRYNLISDLTVEENIKVASTLVKNPLKVSEVLEMVGLSDKAKYYPTQLSGGEQQRVCIARALVKRSEVLLCDEPTGALDTVNANQVIKILQNISKERGIPVVVITHNPSLVVLADHAITISNGEIIDDTLQPFALKAENIFK